MHCKTKLSESYESFLLEFPKYIDRHVRIMKYAQYEINVKAPTVSARTPQK